MDNPILQHAVGTLVVLGLIASILAFVWTAAEAMHRRHFKTSAFSLVSALFVCILLVLAADLVWPNFRG